MTFANGAIQSKKGTGWGNKGAESVLCSAFVGNSLYTGSYSGDIIPWNGRTMGKRIKAHTARVNCMHTHGNNLVSGGHDGKVIVWTAAGAAL